MIAAATSYQSLNCIARGSVRLGPEGGAKHRSFYLTSRLSCSHGRRQGGQAHLASYLALLAKMVDFGGFLAVGTPKGATSESGTLWGIKFNQCL
jgi:hypothetical protein